MWITEKTTFVIEYVRLFDNAIDTMFVLIAFHDCLLSSKLVGQAVKTRTFTSKREKKNRRKNQSRVTHQSVTRDIEKS